MGRTSQRENELEVHYELRPGCNWALQRHILLTRPRSLLVHLVLAALMSWGLWLVLRSQLGSSLALPLGIFLGTAFVFGVARFKSVRRARLTPGLVGPHSLTIGPEGVRATALGIESKVDWPGIVSIEETRSWIFLFLGPMNAFPIPRSAFEGKDGSVQFLERATTFKEGPRPKLARKPFDLWGA